MAKKTGKAAYDEFLAEVLASVPEDKREAIEEALTNDAVVGKAANRVIQQSEFSRGMDKLRQRETELETWYADANKDYSAAVAAAEQYRDLYGDLEDAGTPAPRQTPQTGIDETKLATLLEQRDRMAIKFADVLTDLKDDHKTRFGERLNTESLLEHCQKNGLPLEAGYQSFIADRVEARRKTEFDEAIKKAREDGAREALTSHNLPVAPGPTEVHVLDHQNVKTDPNERIRAVVESFNKREYHPR